MKNQAHQPQFGAASRRATKPERQTGERELLHSAPLTASWVSVSPGVGTWEPFFFRRKLGGFSALVGMDTCEKSEKPEINVYRVGQVGQLHILDHFGKVSTLVILLMH